MERNHPVFRCLLPRNRGFCRFRLAVVVPLFLLVAAGVVYIDQVSVIHSLMTRMDRLERSHSHLLDRFHRRSSGQVNMASSLPVLPPTDEAELEEIVYNTPPLQNGDDREEEVTSGAVYYTKNFLPEMAKYNEEEDVPEVDDEDDVIIVPNRPEAQVDVGAHFGDGLGDQGPDRGQYGAGGNNLHPILSMNDRQSVEDVQQSADTVQNGQDMAQQQLQQLQPQQQQQQQQQPQINQPIHQYQQQQQQQAYAQPQQLFEQHDSNPQNVQQPQTNLQNQLAHEQYQQKQMGPILPEPPSTSKQLSPGQQMAPVVQVPKITPLQADNSNKELARFQAMLNSWPQDKPKAVVFYHLNARRIAKFREAIQSLDRFFNNHHRYPVILFHETDLVESHKKIIRTWTTSDIFFQILEFSIPEWVHRPPEEWLHTCGFAGLDQRHRCRFYSVLLPDQPILQGIDLYWRLGDDAVLLSDVPFDVFEHMRDHALTHAYVRLVVARTTECIDGLRSNSTWYARDRGLQTTFLDRLPETLSLYSNFEISRLSFWRNPMVKEYLSFIDRTGGIYYKHWGDGVIKTIALAIFESIDKIALLKDIKYQQKQGASDDNQVYISSIEKYLKPSPV